VTIELLILPGDDIGPEISESVHRVLEALGNRGRLNLDIVTEEIGLQTLAKEGSTFPERVMERVLAADGVVLGPVSTYDYPLPEEGGINPSGHVRSALELYANIRPARTVEGVASPARSMGKSMDLVVVRENTEGFYADRNMFLGSGEFQPTEDIALAVRKITRHGSERVARAAFDLAMRRSKRVTVVHKANVLRVSDGLFLDAVHSVRRDYPNVELDEMIVDAMAAMLIRKPDSFDVVVTTNMFGDILSDEAAELAGGLGLGAALNAGDTRAVAQATHGSAPDISGRGIANPSALLMSTAMLLSWLGDRDSKADIGAAGARLETAILATLADSANHTPDLGGSATTTSFTDAVIRGIVAD
jgi:3-isopropylmalate dehydrogenase